MLSAAASAIRSPIGVTALCTLLFAGGLFLGQHFSHWVTTSIAALGSLLLVRTSSKGALRRDWVPSRRSWISGSLGGLVLALLTQLAYSPVATHLPELRPEVARLYSMLDSPPGRFGALPLLLLVVIAEEQVWRGVLHGALAKRCGAGCAIIAGSFCYAVPQLASGSWLLPLVALGCGMIWAAQRAHSGGLVAPIMSHFLWDVSVFLIMPLEACR